MRGDKPMVEVELIYRNETRGGGLWVEKDDLTEVCLPLSRIEVHGEKKKNAVVTIVMPEDLATEKGLV